MPIVPVIDRNVKVPICVDLKMLNLAANKENYSLLNLDDVWPKRNIANFSKLHATSGLHQIPLSRGRITENYARSRNNYRRRFNLR